MKFYVVLAIATVVTILLTLAIWRKTKNIAFPLGFGLLYYWTLFGAWSIVAERLDSGVAKPYDYLYYKMFPVYLDEDYFWALILYSVFLVSIQITVLCIVKKAQATQSLQPTRIYISHARILLFSAVAALVSYLLVRNLLSAAADMDTSMHFINPEEAPFYTLHQFLNRAAVAPLFVGFAVYLSGKKAKYIGGDARSWSLTLGYFALLAGVFVFNLMIGARNTLMFGVLAMGLFYFANSLRPRKLLLMGGGVLALLGVSAVGVLRDGYKRAELGSKSGFDAAMYFVSDLGSQTESVAAHLSMYGTLHHDVPISYGASLQWLVSSVIPRAVLPDRPAATYDLYLQGVGAIEGQGYTIHHATGWYLNFGVAGIIAGGCLLGWIWATLFNRSLAAPVPRSLLSEVFQALSFSTFTAFLPMLVRDGPEAYKGVVLECLLIPALVISFASMRMILRCGRLTVTGSRQPREPQTLAGSAFVPAHRIRLGVSMNSGLGAR